MRSAIGGAAKSFNETGQSTSSGVRMNAPALVIWAKTSSPLVCFIRSLTLEAAL
jgi:hypothetical protein